MEIAYRRCCGIDVHKKKLTVYVLPPEGQTSAKPLEREFRTLRGISAACGNGYRNVG